VGLGVGRQESVAGRREGK